jgi:L-fuconolactonase
MKLADAHVHFFRSGYRGRYGRPSSGGQDVEVYLSLMREHGIGLALAVGYEGDRQYRTNNAYLTRLAGQRDWIVPLAYTPADKPASPGGSFLGVAIYVPNAAAATAFARWPEQTIADLAARSSIVSINAVPEALTVAADSIRRLAGCQVLISHLGLPGRFEQTPSRSEVASALKPLLSLSRHTHVGVKLSGLYALSSPMHAYPHLPARPFIDRIVDAFGTERLCWGSDFSPALDYVSFAQTVHAVSDLAWSDRERSAVMGGNLRRLVAAARRRRRNRASR